MSGIAYPPPTEILPIFDESVFNVNQNIALTEAQANLLYLKFPTAQGTETFGDIFVNSNATLNCPVQINSNLLQLTGTSSIQFPDLSIQTTAYTGTAGVASSVVVAPGGVGQTYLALTQGTGGPFPILTNTPQYNATTGVLSAPQFTGSLNGNATTATTANISSNSAISSGGSGSMYLALTQGTGGNFPIQTNIPTYDATSLVLTAPIFNGTTYITSPLLTTSPNGTVRIASTTGLYSSLQQSNIGLQNDLNLTVPSAGLFRVITGGTAILPSSNAGTGLAIGWNSTNGDGATDFINYAQGSPTGGFYFYNVSNATNSALIGRIPTTQPAFGDTSTTSIPTNSWVNGTINAGGFAKLATANTFTAQNTFNNFCPQTPIAPTVNNSLVNLQYLNSVLTTNGIQNYNFKNSYNTNQNNSTFNSIQIQIPQSQFTSSAPPYKALKIRFNYVLTGNSNNLMITNSGILNLYPLNTTSTSNTSNYSYIGTGGGTPFSNPPNEYKYNITNNMYTSSGTLSNAYNALYTDDNAGLGGLKRWYYVSNVNGGSPSGFSGTPYFSYLSYSYNGAGQFSVGFTTPPSPMPITTSPTYTGDPSYGTATQLNLNIFMEVISNDFIGSTVVLQ